MPLKLFFAILSLIPAAFAYFYYIRDIFKDKTKPHAFSWLIWGLLAANGFIAQVHAHAGFGAWSTGFTSFINLVIFCLAIRKGDNKPAVFDWFLLAVALIGFSLLFVINNKTIALWITLGAMTTGFIMTIRKSRSKPNEETAKSFVLNAVKIVPSIPALTSYSFLTLGYPVVALCGNAAIACTIYLSRQRVQKASIKATD